MLLKPLTVAAAGLATATAFLVPPEVTSAEADNANAFPLEIPHTAERQLVELSCPGCPLQLKKHHGKVRLAQGLDSHFELTFNVDHAPESDRLLLNGFELYPHPDPMHQALTAPHIPDLHESDRGYKRIKKLKTLAPTLGFTLETKPVTKDVADQMELIALDLQIVEVGTTFVDGVPNVHIKLVKTADGALMIGDIKTTESQTAQDSPMEKLEECTTMMCKWRAIVKEHFKHFTSHKCGKTGKFGKMGGHHKGPHPHHHHHHGGRPFRQQLREHKWSQLFKTFASHILFPILVGIVAGIFVSVIGMVIGTLIIGLWRVFVRKQSFFRHHCRRHAGRAHHKAAQKEAAVAEEKSGLMEDQDLPPSYDDEVKKTDV